MTGIQTISVCGGADALGPRLGGLTDFYLPDILVTERPLIVAEQNDRYF
jgi:hypothetical protein